MTTTLTNSVPGVGDLARLAAQLRRATGVTLKPDVLPALIANESFVYVGGSLADIALMVKAATERVGPFAWIANSPNRYKVRAAILSAFQDADYFMFKVGRARQHYGTAERLAAGRAGEIVVEANARRKANTRAARQRAARAALADLGQTDGATLEGYGETTEVHAQ
jgi:hypothetical protein